MGSFSAGRGDDEDASQRPLEARDNVARASLDSLRRSFPRRLEGPGKPPQTITTIAMETEWQWDWNKGLGLYERQSPPTPGKK